MPWWLSFALDWFPAVLVALAAMWWLELPIGASIVVFLLVVGISRLVQRLLRRGGGPAARSDGGTQGSGTPGGGSRPT